MSLKQFLRKTRLLLEQAAYEIRRTQSDSPAPRAIQLMQLEERLLFSAGPVAAVVDAIPAATISDAGSASITDSASHTDVMSRPSDTESVSTSSADRTSEVGPSESDLLELLADTVLPAGNSAGLSSSESNADGSVSTTATDSRTLELVFIDPSVGDVNRLISELQAVSLNDPSRTLEFVALESDRDGVARITSALMRFQDVNGIHIVSSGTGGEVTLGSAVLSAETIVRYQTAISGWQFSLAESADILIYGCNLSATDSGASLLQQVSSLTGASAAANESLVDQDDATIDASVETSAAPSVSTELLNLSTGQWDIASLPGSEYSLALSVPRTEVVFLDTGIEDYEQILADLQSQGADGTIYQIQLLDNARDGLQQINAFLSQLERPVDAVHFITHGTDRALKLGSSWIDTATLNARQAEFQQWGQYLNPNADLLFYGCELAGAESGRGILESIAAWTGADVAGSDDETGSALLGGDWQLEYQYGALETHVVTSQQLQSNWQGLMATFTVTNTNNSGAGSLRQAILDANALGGLDVIQFAISGTGVHTISVASSMTITEAVTIDATTDDSFGTNSSRPAIILDGNNSFVGDGFVLSSTADGTTIRGFVIRDFSGDGIEIQANSNGNTIVGNYIGRMDSSGVDSVGNANTGVGIRILGANNIIGGTSSSDRNLVSGNDSHGIYITGASATGNTILGNYIGTTITGLVDLGNALNGIYIDTSASNNTIGGMTAASRNIISGNDNAGIAVDNAGTTGNLIIGNYIGIGSDGSTALGNTHNGINFNASGANTVGSTDVNGRNVISSNAIHGIGASDATGVTILGNYFGVDATGTLARGNAGDGIRISGTSSGISIGGTAAGAGNVIANNTGDGVLVSSSSATAASILQNSIYGNGEQGIDLGSDDGLTYNDISDSDTGSNNLVNFPILKTATSSGGNTTITGKVTGLASTTFRVEFFTNSYGIQDTIGYGEATTYIGTVDVTTDSSGNGTFSSVLNGVTLETGATVTATATQISGATPVATSEFAGNILANQTNLMVTGSYVGNGVDNRVYSGLGFRPEAVIIFHGTNSQVGVLRTSTMAGDATKELVGATALAADMIQSITADGFTLGTSTRVNSNGTTYYWVAFGAGDMLDVGSFSGSGSTQSITGVGFQSELVVAASAGTGRSVFSSSLTSGTSYRWDNTAVISTAITSFGTDGFSVGTDTSANQSSSVMHYVAFNQNSNYFVQGSYVGNGADNRNITGVGFEPELVITRAATGTNYVGLKSESTGYNVDADYGVDASGTSTNGIQALQSDGFQVGSASWVNTNATTYNYFAFKQNDAPLIVDTTSDTSDGTTTNINALRGSRGADGKISLREAIAATNATRNVNGTVDEVQFAIPGTGVQTITVGSTALPTITDGLKLDAWTEPGYTSSPLIELNGGNTGVTKDGLSLQSGSAGSTIRGFIINRFTGDGIEVNSSNNSVIEGNWIGLNNTGTSASANALRGLYAINSTGLTIGGTSTASRNVISGNTQQGIYFDNVDTSFVYGNYVGTNVAGTGDINGTTANTAQTGFVMLNGSSGNQIGNTSLAGARNVFSGNNHYGVEIQTNTSVNNTVVGNFIGTDATGLAALGNTNGGFSFWGSGTGNLLGGNVVSGNLGVGILVGSSASGSQIQGNYVGVGVDGSTSVGNGSTGIFVGSSGLNTLIGTNADGTNDVAEANTVSGNLDGIVVTDAGTTGTMIYGNYIGTTANGMASRGNTWDGVRVANGATGTLIGGSGTARRNFISGNGQDGIQIDGEATDGNTIQNNWIGLAADGVTVLGNGGDGIYINGGADNTVIGGIGLGNVIMGARVAGIEIDGASTGTSILGNLIGINAAGTVIQGSGQNGILLENGAASTVIGGTTAGQGNTIVDSGRLSATWQSAVSVTSTAGTANTIVGNSIYDNRGLGIDLGATGVTANDNLDPDSGPNNLQNTPVLTTATTNGSTVTISGTLNTLASTAGILIHFYATPSNGTVNTRQGRRYLGSTTVSTNASGNATFTTVALSAAVTAGELITATTTLSSNTSEFSQAIIATA